MYGERLKRIERKVDAVLEIVSHLPHVSDGDRAAIQLAVSDLRAGTLKLNQAVVANQPKKKEI